MIIAAFFSGIADAIDRELIYDTPFINAVALTISPFRIFSENYAVTEYKCLKEQSGFTSKIMYIFDHTNFDRIDYGKNDRNISLRDCSGWYWNAWPSVLISLCVLIVAAMGLHIKFRIQMCKPSFRHSSQNNTNRFHWG